MITKNNNAPSVSHILSDLSSAEDLATNCFASNALPKLSVVMIDVLTAVLNPSKLSLYRLPFAALSTGNSAFLP